VVIAAADGEGVARLVYIAGTPWPVRTDPWPTDWVRDNPVVRDLGNGTFVLDTDLWLDAEAHRFPADVVAHLRARRRRPMSFRCLTDPQPTAAWTTISTTVLLGKRDDMVGPDNAAAAKAAVPDVRMLDCDHFVPFRLPQVIADTVIEATGNAGR
jgi:hypothetical protein